MCACTKEHACRTHAEQQAEIRAQNLRVIEHELQTPMRGHEGQCCIRARLGVEPHTAETI